MVENGKKHRQNIHLIIHCPMSGASERANGRASGPVLQSVFLAIFDHSAALKIDAAFNPKHRRNYGKGKGMAEGLMMITVR